VPAPVTTSKPQAHIPFKLGTDMDLVLRRSVLLAVLLAGAVFSAAAANPDTTTAVCPAIAPGGDVEATRFLPVPAARAREILADAMQATGVYLYKNTDRAIEGGRMGERIKALRLPGGDEVIRATLTAATEDGKPGTRVQVETMRPSNKKGTPKQSWSAAVMEQAACLMSMLSVDDPMHRPAVPLVDAVEIQIPASTALQVRSRRFFFNTEVKVGQTIAFETSERVVIDGVTVIPAGSFVAASMQELSDSKSFGRAAKGQLEFKYVVLPDRTRLPLRGGVDFTGKSTHTKGVVAEGATLATTAAIVYMGGTGPLGDVGLSNPGLGFAVPAGTMMTVQIDGEQKVRVNGATSSGKDEK